MVDSQSHIQRVTRSKKEARATYNRLSRWYDWLGSVAESKLVRSGLCLLDAQDGEHVLEIGPGTGRALVALARAVGESGSVRGVDLSEGMLRIARDKVCTAALARRVELVGGDATNLPYASNSFDATFMSLTLELFDTPEIPAVLAECKRVLRLGGRLGVVAMSRNGANGAMLRLYEWAHRTFPRYVDCRPIYAEQALLGAGFKVVESALGSVWGLSVETILAVRG